MNIFKEQKEEKNRTLAILEDMKKTIEELNQLEKVLNEKADILNSNNRILSEKVETLDIARIGKYINSNEANIENQIKKMESAINAFKIRIEAKSLQSIDNYTKKARIVFYMPLIAFMVMFTLISYFYFTNVRYIQAQTKELVRQNKLLKDRINNVYWILADDQKFWYDKESKKYFIQDNKWIKDYKKNLQKKKN